MKSNQVTKLYAKLTPEEQAALVFEASVNHDWNTVDTIINQVTRHSYTMLNVDYLWRSNALQFLAMHYGIEYWKTRALMLLSIDYAATDELENSFLAKAMALEAAIVEVCKPLKVDVAVIKKMAGCMDIDFLPKDRPASDELLVTQYTEILATLIADMKR